MALSYQPIEIIEEGKNSLLVKADHWERVFVCDIAKVQNGFAYKSEFFSRDKGIPLIRIRDIFSSETEHRYFGEFDDSYLVSRGDLLIGMDGDFVASLWPGDRGLLNQRVCRVVIESDNYDKNFFFLALQPYLDAIHAKTSSVTVKHLSSKTINEIPLPLPPLNEQKRIVAKIEELFSELDAGVESLTKAKEQLGVYRQSLLKHAFDGKLTEEWRKENADKIESGGALLKRVKKEREVNFTKQLEQWEKDVDQWEANGKPGKKPTKPKRPKKLAPISEEELKKLPELPDGWVWVRLGMLPLDVFDGPFGSNLKGSDYVDSGVRVIRLENIGDLAFIHEKKSFVTEEKYASLIRHHVSNGDVIFSSFIAGSTRVVVLPENIDRAINKADCFCVRIYSHHFYNGYLSKFLSTRAVYLQLENKVHGATRPRINTTQLKDVIVPACSISEQLAISERIESAIAAISQTLASIEIRLEESTALKKSILQKVFSGELIPQDPNDEPASKLLERIKQERKSSHKPKQTRKPNKKAKRISMANLKEVLATANEWVSAQDAFRQCGVGNGAPTDEVEKLYEELKQQLNQKVIEVERRGDEDWFRLVAEG